MKSLGTAFLAAMVGLSVAAPSIARADGRERVVTIERIPAAAKAGLEREADGAPIRRIEIETKNNATVYEAVVQNGNDEMGITVDAQGNLLGRHPEFGEHPRGGE
jgi:hypothetical protein